jgi:hypothetical protein
MERYVCKDVFNHTWKLTQKEYDDFTNIGIALKMYCNGEIVRNRNWVLLRDTIGSFFLD